MKTVQYFTKEYLEHCSKLSTGEILEFLEDFRLLHAPENRPERSKLISIRVPERLLAAFRKKATFRGTAYQTQIKRLMEEWLKGSL